MRILAIDPGEKRIGLALSDPTRTIAASHTVLLHSAFDEDVLAICNYSEQNDVDTVVIGLALNDDGGTTTSSRRAEKLGNVLKNKHQLNVIYIDEYGTTNLAKQIAIELGTQRKKRRGHLDNLAATIILQRFLEQIHALRDINL